AQPRQNAVNKGRRSTGGCPRRGDRGGDTQKGSIPNASRRAQSLKKGSSRCINRHHSTSLRFFGDERPRFYAGTTGFFAVEERVAISRTTPVNDKIIPR